ncbi:MAG: M48 family peptidase, partial [Comamonas sp.]
MASNPDFSLSLSLLFAAAVVLQWLLRAWLVSRQVRHVAAHRAAVPAAFAQHISLAAHQKAADYTLAKAKVSLIDMTLSAAVLLCWTLLGGLDALNLWLFDLLGAGMWQQLALLGGFALI